MVLYVNVVLAAVAVAGAVRLMASHPRDPDVHIDWPGTVLVVAGLVAIVYGLSEADTAGWGAPTASRCWWPGRSCWSCSW